MNVYCAGILFNAAILHHQDAIKTGNSVSLDEAHRLYKASLHLLIILPASFEYNDTVALLEVANTNNLAQIELEKGLVMEASERLQMLTQLFQTSQSTMGNIFTNEEIEGILTNTLVGHGIISSPAA